MTSHSPEDASRDRELVSALCAALDGARIVPNAPAHPPTGKTGPPGVIARLQSELATAQRLRQAELVEYAQERADGLSRVRDEPRLAEQEAQAIREHGHGTIHEAYWLAMFEGARGEYRRLRAYGYLCLDMGSSWPELQEEAAHLLEGLELLPGSSWERLIDGFQDFPRSPFLAAELPAGLFDPHTRDIDDLLSDLRGRYQDGSGDADSPEHKVDRVIGATALACGVLALQPFPLADVFVLTPVQIVMIVQIGELMGCPMEGRGARAVLLEIIGAAGGGLLAQHLIIAAYKTFLPFAGAVTTIPTVAAVTYGIGQAAKVYFASMRENRHASREELRRAALSGAKESEDRLSRELKQRQSHHEEEMSRLRRTSEREIADLRQQLKRADEQASRDAAAGTQLQGQLSAATERASSLAPQVTELRQRLEQAQARPQVDDPTQREAAEQYLSELAEELAQLSQERNEARIRAAALQEQWAASEQLRSAAETERDQLRGRLHEATERRSEKYRRAVLERWSGLFPGIQAHDRALRQFCELTPEDQGRVENTLAGLFEGRESRVPLKAVPGVWRTRYSQDGRLYCRGAGSAFELLCMGLKNSQSRDIEWLRGLQ